MELKIFLHICCAPCLAYFCEYFKKNDISWKGYFFNPNIHPEEEYNKRTDCLEKFIMENNYSVDFNGGYSEQEFINRISFNTKHWKESENNRRNAPNGTSRCNVCYEWRLKETARGAKKQGYKFFSTTLLISPYQDHDKIKKLGEEIAKGAGLEFYYKDFRPFFREGRKIAKENNLYLQKYCGCIYSKNER